MTRAAPPAPPFDNPQKRRRGLTRLWHATAYSARGLRMAWAEPAFRTEAVVALLAVPLALWLGRGWLEPALLLASLVLLLVVELLNTAVEAAIDRVGPEWHPLSGQAKDLGSAAVLLCVLLATALWLTVLVRNWLL